MGNSELRIFRAESMQIKISHLHRDKVHVRHYGKYPSITDAMRDEMRRDEMMFRSRSRLEGQEKCNPGDRAHDWQDWERGCLSMKEHTARGVYAKCQRG